MFFYHGYLIFSLSHQKVVSISYEIMEIFLGCYRRGGRNEFFADVARLCDNILLMWRSYVAFCWCGALMWHFFVDIARLCSVPRKQKNQFPPSRQLLTVNVGQHKRCSLYCTNIYSSVPKLSPEILITPICSRRNSLKPFFHLYPYV